jgi:serine phosphatase RsbU (regulator of sigma subunit)
MSGPVIAAVLVVVLGLVWAIALVSRSGRLARSSAGGAEAREALTHFADQSLELQSVADILAFAREAAQAVFGTQRVVAFVAGAEAGAWDASVPGAEKLPEPPMSVRGLFGWLKHNTAIAVEADLGQARFGAMRGPMRQVMDGYGIDVIMPLVERKQILAVLGLRLGRRPTVVDRGLMRLFRLQATAACANVRLHREAAHMVSLAQEVDLASAVQLALVPDEMDGDHGGISWRGSFEVAGDAGSDFWGVYPMGDDRVMMIIGDAIGAGLGGSMVSAVVKSCADAIFDDAPTSLDPGRLLGALNRALYRSTSPVHTSCFAILFDAAAGRLHYANAGHEIPYRLSAGDQGANLGALTGAGPLLGDAADARYKVQTVELPPGELVVLFTDGLTKIQGDNPKPLGERGLQRLLKKASHGHPDVVRRQLLEGVAGYRGGAPLRDDAALVIVQARASAS